MMTNNRWMKSVLKASAECTVTMPWTRGPRRAASVARRRRPAVSAHQAKA
jgi:hypothetical protein